MWVKWKVSHFLFVWTETLSCSEGSKAARFILIFVIFVTFFIPLISAPCRLFQLVRLDLMIWKWLVEII